MGESTTLGVGQLTWDSPEIRGWCNKKAAKYSTAWSRYVDKDDLLQELYIVYLGVCRRFDPSKAPGSPEKAFMAMFVRSARWRLTNLCREWADRSLVRDVPIELPRVGEEASWPASNAGQIPDKSAVERLLETEFRMMLEGAPKSIKQMIADGLKTKKKLRWDRSPVEWMEFNNYFGLVPA